MISHVLRRFSVAYLAGTLFFVITHMDGRYKYSRTEHNIIGKYFMVQDVVYLSLCRIKANST